MIRDNRRKEKRQHSRSDSSWLVRWRDSKGMPQQGCLCDIGPGGAFIRPFVGSHIDDLQDGTSVVLTILVGTDGRSGSLPVGTKPRWRGVHKSNRLPGLGVAFDAAQTLDALRSLEQSQQRITPTSARRASRGKLMTTKASD